jgi:RNA polymerase sigma factor (sigma-70 family)
MTIADTLRHLGLASPDPRSDGELVTRFVASRDEPAFAELLRRHGPTVYGVCRRVLGNAADADDAFQAVFLVLARKAGTVRPPGMVGNWLYGVAVRTANKARVMNARNVSRRRQSPGGFDDHPATGVTGSPDRDTLAVIDAELAALPDVYRAAFVACGLNGRSRSKAARELGWPEGTVAARLAKARQLLAARLTKRGVTLGAGLFAAAAVPSATAADTLSAVRELLAVGTASAVAPAAQTLSDEVANAMTTNPAKWLLLGGLVLTLGTGWAVLLAGGPEKQPVREPIKAPVPKVAEAEWKEGKPIESADGKPITGVAVSPDGKLIAIAQRGRVELLEADTRTRRFLIEEKDPATVTSVAFSPKGDKIAVTGKDHVLLRGVDVKDPGETWELKGVDPRQVVWLSEDSIVVVNGTEVVWRVREDRAWDRYHWSQAGEVGNLMPLAPLPGQSKVFVTSGEAEKEANELHFVARPLPSPQARLAGHKSRPIAAAVSADGQRIVSADEGGTIIVWEGEKLEFKEKRRIELGEGIVQLALAADGKTVAAVRAYSDTDLFGTSGRTLFNLELFVFDLTNPPAKPKTLWSHCGLLSDEKTFTGPVSLVFSPDGKTLLAAFADPYITDKDAKSMGVKVWELVPKK